jgi:signal transduction histidine kinase
LRSRLVGFRVEDLRLWIRDKGSGLKVKGSGFRVQGLGVRV